MHPKKLIRPLVALALVVSGISILSLVIANTENAGNKDFVSYWAAGQLLIRHSNPYDAAAVLRVEKSVGFQESKPLIMRNAPFALVLALPLGLVPAKLGVVLWSLLLVASIMASVRVLWSINGRPPDRPHLFGYIFAPTLACMTLGQTSVFALLGLVLFLRFHLTRPVVAGVCIALLAIKPHLVLPLGLVLLLWVQSRRAYSVLLGAAAGILCAMIPPIYFDRSVLAHYWPVLTQANAESARMPNLSAIVRLGIDPHAAWAQFAPTIVGCLWGIWYFSRNAKEWDWNRHGSLLLLASVWVAPFSWFTDEIIVLPAILAGISRSENRSLIGFCIINGIALAAVLFGVVVGSGFYVWTSTAWLFWYLCVVHRR
jgi:hypothetical protein